MNPYLYRFCTDVYPDKQRFEVWRDEVNPIFDVSADKNASGNFNYELTTGYIGSILMGCGRWVGEGEPIAYDVRRPLKMVRTDGLDHYYLCYGITHSLAGYAARAPINAEASSLYVLDLAYELESQIIAGDTLILTIPRDLVHPRVKAGTLHGTVLQGPLSSLLVDHMRALQRQLPHIAPADMPHVEQATLAMISAALAPTLHTLADAEKEIDQALLHRVRRHIDAHLTSADLTPTQICRDVGISRAHLYRLFAWESGVAAYIQQRRLRKIRHILESAQGRGKRISSVAFEFGFKTESHFSRAFRDAFGFSPRDAKERGAALDAERGGPARARPAAKSLRDVLNTFDQ